MNTLIYITIFYLIPLILSTFYFISLIESKNIKEFIYSITKLDDNPPIIIPIITPIINIFFGISFIIIIIQIITINIIDCYKHIPKTIKHRKAFNKTQKKLIGYKLYKYHDLDKVLMYLFLPFLGIKIIKKIHQKTNEHHIQNYKSRFQCDYLEAMIDWECSRFTKQDKQMTAREYLNSKKLTLLRVHYEQMDDTLKLYNL